MHGTHEITATHVHAVSFLWLIPFFPLVGAATNALFGARLQRRLGKKVNHSIAVGAMVLSALTAWVAFAKLVGLPEGERFLRDHVWTMARVGTLELNLSFGLDALSMTMTLIVTNVATLIHVYSIGYMAEEPSYWRFFAWLNLFVFSMLLLVMGDSFALMFFGWEGVGLCSYLLISFWYKQPPNARAGMKAFVVNRVGDFGFVLGLFLLFWTLGGAWNADHSYGAKMGGKSPRAAAAEASDLTPRKGGHMLMHHGMVRASTPGAGGIVEVGGVDVKVGPTLDFRELRDQLATNAGGIRDHLRRQALWGIPVVFLICLFLFVGATGKSAQIPLYVWLPDAMAGPTPVSALIHAATMVTAGVYMVARLNFLFAMSPSAMGLVAGVGVLTALFAATIGFFQYDIKKVLAYSTVSQLGFMFIGVGTGAYWAGIYHLLTHAFFKACLFLGSGSVILGCHHEQDMRKMGGLKKHMPLTEKTYRYACVAITAAPIPFIANGFFSKDEILWKAFTAEGLRFAGLFHLPGWAIWIVGWMAAAGTAFYMWRSYYMTFTGEYRGGSAHGHLTHAPAPALALAGAAPAGAHPRVVAHSLGAAHASDPAVTGHAHDGHAHAATHDDQAHDAHGAHGALPHESPRTMTWVLVALAIGCLGTILLGFWPPLGHLLHIEWMTEPLLERWLAPVFAPGAQFTRFAAPGAAVEWGLMGTSVAVALGGWLTARALYKDAKSPVPARMLAAWPRVHKVVFNKYYVDELYHATVVRGSLMLSQALFWIDQKVVDGLVNLAGWVGRFLGEIDGAIDKHLVDGVVNLVADGTIAFGRAARRVQTGRIQVYLYGAMAGALLFVALNYIW